VAWLALVPSVETVWKPSPGFAEQYARAMRSPKCCDLLALVASFNNG
jgi:hypothetical protein